MAKDYAKAFYNSTAWHKTRGAYIIYQRGQCERCKKEFEAGKRNLEDINPGVIVHHKDYITPENLHDPKIALCFDNLELLCDLHHNREHTATKKRRYYFASDGSLIQA